MWDVVWCAVPKLNVVRCEILLSYSGRDVECITHCISHLVTSRPPHFTLHYSTSNAAISGIIPNHTTFHVTPFLTISHISYRTSTSSPLCIPYLKSHILATLCITSLTSRTAPHFHITDVPHNATSVSDHTIYWPHHLCITPPATSRTTDIFFFNDIAPHFTCSPSCISSTTPNSTPHYHVSHNIPHHRSGHHHFLHPTTYHISHNTISITRYRAVSAHTLPCSISHAFHIPCHSTHTSPHYTTTFHNPILVWNRLETICDPFC